MNYMNKNVMKEKLNFMEWLHGNVLEFQPKSSIPFTRRHRKYGKKIGGKNTDSSLSNYLSTCIAITLLGKTQTLKTICLCFRICNKIGNWCFTSVPLMQGRLLQPGVMPDLVIETSMRALQFIRLPRVIAPLVGQKSQNMCLRISK